MIECRLWELYTNIMTNAEIKEFKRFMMDTLITQYDMSEVETYRAVRDSYLSEALKKDNDFVEHDTVEEWAEIINKEITSGGISI